MQHRRGFWLPVLHRLLIVVGAALLISGQYVLGGGFTLALVISIWANGRSAEAKAEPGIIECLRTDGLRLRRYALRGWAGMFVLLQIVLVAAGAVTVASEIVLVPTSALTGALIGWTMWATTLP
jgi:hypothetical protein